MKMGNQITIPGSFITFKINDVIQLQADNGKYVIVDKERGMYLALADGDITNSSTYFTVSAINDDYTINLTSWTVRQIMSRYDFGTGDGGYLAACKSEPDQYCALKLACLWIPPATVQLAMQADNQLWYSRFTKDGQDFIIASKSSIDQYCLFTVTTVPQDQLSKAKQEQLAERDPA